MKFPTETHFLFSNFLYKILFFNQSYRESINDEYFATGSNANVEINSLEQHLRFKYFNKWQSATSADPSKDD